MSDENYDISQVQVPDALIQQILEQTPPLEEEPDTVQPSQAKTSISEDGKVVELLSLMFEEFDRLNSRLDALQSSIHEMTTVGMMGVNMAGGDCEEEPKSKKKKKDARATLADLLAKRISK
jgi:hypothetical protein